MGTWFSDKYAEGTVGHRFYAGCQNVDTVESLAAEHARELFGAPYAYVQPHSGIDANLVAFWSILAHRVEGPALEKPRRQERQRAHRGRLGVAAPRVRQPAAARACRLDAGGHLTHGFRPNISGKMFHQQQYGTDPETGLLDYDAVRAKAREFKPLVLVAGYSAYPRRVNFAKMREIADEVGAVLMVDMAHFAGLVAGKVFTGDEDPVPVRPHHHHHDPQVAARPARRHGAGAGGVRGRRRPRLPDGARRPALARDGRQGRRALPRPASRSSRPTPRRSPTTPSRSPRASSPATPTSSPAAPTTTSCCSTSSSFGLTGRQAESALLDAGVVTNRNSVPTDPNGAWYTSGIRLGTPALTTRGFGHDEFDKVAELIVEVLSNTQPGTTKAGEPGKASYVLADGVADRVQARSAEMLDKHPLYPGLDLS